MQLVSSISFRITHEVPIMFPTTSLTAFALNLIALFPVNRLERDMEGSPGGILGEVADLARNLANDANIKSAGSHPCSRF